MKLEYSGELLKAGAEGSDVRSLQKALTALGYDLGKVDGDFGSATEREVKELQAGAGLTPDGIVGPKTFEALNTAIAQAVKIGGLPPVVLKDGSEGSEVKRLQAVLKRWGYLDGAIDGKFGPQTANAVKAFQTDEEIDVDGVVGHQTVGEINDRVLDDFEAAMAARKAHAEAEMKAQQAAEEAERAAAKAEAEAKAADAAKAEAKIEKTESPFDAFDFKKDDAKSVGFSEEKEERKGGLFGMFKRRKKNRRARR